MKTIDVLKSCGTRAAVFMCLIIELSKLLFELAIVCFLAYLGYWLFTDFGRWYWKVLGVLLMFNVLPVLRYLFEIVMTLIFGIMILIWPDDFS